MPRFVILRHEMPSGGDRATHWDLLLENEGVLLAWALESTPESDSRIAADALPDHRLLYLDYEGPISGGRGDVTRWDHGEFQCMERRDGLLAIELRGAKLCGPLRLQRESGQRWSVRLGKSAWEATGE